jgi:pilus assembly protein Flp/PilA
MSVAPARKLEGTVTVTGWRLEGNTMNAAARITRRMWAEDAGQGLVEYALIIALVAVGLIAILLVLRNSIGNVFNNAATQLNNAPTNPYP